MFKLLLLGVLSFGAERALAFEVVRPIENYEPGSYDGRVFGCCDRRHLGEDIAAEPLTPVYAIADGEVLPLVSGAMCYYGMAVVIEHHLDDGSAFTSVYGHLSNRPGYEPRLRGAIRRGEIVGYVAHSGGRSHRRDCRRKDDENGDGDSHLHLGIRLGHAPKKANGLYDWVYFGYAGKDHNEDVDFDDRGRAHGGKFTSPVKFLAEFGVTPTNTDDDSDNFSEDDGDCNDNDKFVRPDTFERCQNGIDDNCDGTTDEELHPLGEQCQFKYQGCFLRAHWVCKDGYTLCQPPDMNDCLCRDECEDVGEGTCISEGNDTFQRVCAVDDTTGCTRFLTQRCASNQCRDGRCVRPQDVRIGIYGNCGEGAQGQCDQGLDCVMDTCDQRSKCVPWCAEDFHCGSCSVCDFGHCFPAYRRGASADMADGCPCTVEDKCESGQQCGPRSICVGDGARVEGYPYPCGPAGSGYPYEPPCFCHVLGR